MNKEKLIVDIWEKCFNQHILESALTILNSTYPNVDKKDFAEMSLGKRNYLLTRVHENLFGKSLYCVVSCPECNSQSEFIIATDEITSLNTNEEKELLHFNRMISKLFISCRIVMISHLHQNIVKSNPY